MFSLGISYRYYLYHKPTDMRKGFDSLCGLIRCDAGHEPTDGSVYIFINRRRNLMKLLHWEPGGFVLYYKRLESGTLELPCRDDLGVCWPVQWPELVMMVQGISLKNIQRRKRYVLGKNHAKKE